MTKTKMIEKITRLDNGVEIFTKIKYGNCDLPAFVFCHGIGRNLTAGEFLTDYFNKKGHLTLEYDLPGHGKSEIYACGDWSMNNSSKTFHEILEKNSIKTPIAFGDSFGGMIILNYAVSNPGSIKSAVLMATTASYPIDYAPKYIPKKFLEFYLKQRNEKQKKLFEKQIQHNFQECKDLSDREIEDVVFKCTNPAAYSGFMDSTKKYDVREKLDSLDIPTLIMWGKKDRYVLKGANDDLKKIKNSRFIALDGGHNCLLKNIDEIIGAIEENYGFLAE